MDSTLQASARGVEWAIGSRRSVDRQALVTTNSVGIEHLSPIAIDRPFRVGGQRLLQCYATFKPRQCCAEAEMDPIAECQVQIGTPCYVELIGIGILPL